MARVKSLLRVTYVLDASSSPGRLGLTWQQDCEAYRLQGNEQGWHLVGSLEAKKRPGLGDQREESALNMFRQMDLKGKTNDDTQLRTVHQNTISTIREYEGTGGALRRFSSKLPFIPTPARARLTV